MSVLSGAPMRRGSRRERSGSPRKRSYKPAAERRQEILGHALAAFAERGYHETSIAEVCERAGIGRATLYQYFADKRDLLAALADDIAERVVAALDDRPPLRIPPGFRPTEEQTISFIQARFASVLEVVFENADTARLVLRAGRGADGVVDQTLRKIDQAVLDKLEEELEHAKSSGVIRPVDCSFVARFFLGGVEKIILSYVEENRAFDVHTIAKEAALLEVFGIHARDGAPT